MTTKINALLRLPDVLAMFPEPKSYIHYPAPQGIPHLFWDVAIKKPLVFDLIRNIRAAQCRRIDLNRRH